MGLVLAQCRGKTAMTETIQAKAQPAGESEELRARIAPLELEARRFKAAFYSIGDGVIATDRAGTVVEMNGVAERLTGWTEAQARGRPSTEVFRIVNETSRAEVESQILRVLREGVPCRRPLRDRQCSCGEDLRRPARGAAPTQLPRIGFVAKERPV